MAETAGASAKVRPTTKTSITVSMRMEIGLKAAIDAAAKESGRSISAEIIHRLERYDELTRRIEVAEAIEEMLLKKEASDP